MNREQYVEKIDAWLQESPYEMDERIAQTTSLNSNLFMNQQAVSQWLTKWVDQLPHQQKQQVVQTIDQAVVFFANFFQDKGKCQTVEENVVRQARIFHSQIQDFEQLKERSFEELEYIEDQYKRKYLTYAAAQGGLAGTGQPLLLVGDFPVLLSINLNMVHYMASTYGYSLRDPQEQLIALKVLHAAALPKKYRGPAWQWLMNQYQSDQMLSFQEDGTIIQPEWLETLAKQWMKAFVLYGMKKTTKKPFSLVGVILGATVNHQFTKRVAEWASHFYRYRFLSAEEERNNGRRGT